MAGKYIHDMNESFWDRMEFAWESGKVIRICDMVVSAIILFSFIVMIIGIIRYLVLLC